MLDKSLNLFRKLAAENANGRSSNNQKDLIKRFRACFLFLFVGLKDVYAL